MNIESAEKIIEKISYIDDLFEEVFDLFDELDGEERILYRKKLAGVLIDIYNVIEVPIYNQYPGIKGRRDI